MKIGILQCDDVVEPLRTRHGNYPDMMQKLLTTVDRRLTFQTWRCHEGQIPDSGADADAWITTGSKCGANDTTPWIHDLSAFIQQLWDDRQTLVGICFGHQLMAKALGGRVEKSTHGWGVGAMTQDVYERQPWMTPWHGDTLRLLSSHQDQVTAQPRGGSVILAGNDFCPIYMMQVGDTFLGIQGHPEFTRGYAADLMELRRDIITPARVDAALSSLRLHVDDMMVGRWVVNFMEQAQKSKV